MDVWLNAKKSSRIPVGRELSCRKESPFSLLPLELMVHVFSFLCPQDLLSCRLVSKGFCEAATHETVWRPRCDPSPVSPGKTMSHFLLFFCRLKEAQEARKGRPLVERVTESAFLENKLTRNIGFPK